MNVQDGNACTQCVGVAGTFSVEWSLRREGDAKKHARDDDDLCDLAILPCGVRAHSKGDASEQTPMMRPKTCNLATTRFRKWGPFHSEDGRESHLVCVQKADGYGKRERSDQEEP